MINGCRERDKLDETIEHVIARCSSLSESAYRGRHNKMAKTIRQQIAIKCKPFDRNIAPYCRHKPERVLESADMISYWDMSIVTDTTVGFNIPDTVLIDRQNKTALVTDVAVFLTHKLSSIEAEEIMKYENLALQIKNIRKLNNVSVYPLVISVEGVSAKTFLNI